VKRLLDEDLNHWKMKFPLCNLESLTIIGQVPALFSFVLPSSLTEMNVNPLTYVLPPVSMVTLTTTVSSLTRFLSLKHVRTLKLRTSVIYSWSRGLLRFVCEELLKKERSQDMRVILLGDYIDTELDPNWGILLPPAKFRYHWKNLFFTFGPQQPTLGTFGSMCFICEEEIKSLEQTVCTECSLITNVQPHTSSAPNWIVIKRTRP